MKKSRKMKFVMACGYIAFVVLLLLGTRCESRIHLTTPERDAKHIAELAEMARTEAELKVVEKMRARYEQAYRESYGGAKALYFRSLVDPVLDEVGDRREALAAEEAYLDSQLDNFYGKLNDLNKAWKMELGTKEDALAVIEKNDATIAAKTAELEAMIAAKDQLALDIIDAGYPEDMLHKIGEAEANIEVKREEIAEVEDSSYILELAYRLQRGEELVTVEPIVDESEADATLDVVEEVVI